MDIPNLQDFLQAAGVLEGTDEEIAKAKLAYQKFYQKKYNQEYKKKRRRITVTFLPFEYDKLVETSKIYEASVPQFVRQLALEHIDEKKNKLIPYPNDHAYLVQELSSFHRTIQELKIQATDYITIQQGYEMISQKVNDLQAHLLGYDY